MSAYIPILGLVVLAAVFVWVAAIWLSPLIGPHRYNRTKYDSFECGIQPTPQTVTGGGRFAVKYYVTAMLFIVFDIEIVFLYPWAVSFGRLGLYAFVEMLIFFSLLAFGLWYAWKKGDLSWVTKY